jgi:uncharacterized repeat protein (TIGR01451 family)
MRRAPLAFVFLLAALAAAPSANAATTIGQVFTPTASTSATVLQTGISSGVGYTVPSDGVITGWTFQADPDGATVKLKAGRRNSDGTYTIAGESDFQKASPNQLMSFPARIPVHAGDVVGTSAAADRPDGTAGKTVAYTGGNDDQVVLSPGDQPAGSTGNYSNVQGIRVDVTASIEPDADADGFGDETQDLCTNDPTVQTACAGDLQLAARAERGTVNPGDEVGFVLTVTNGGPSRSVGVKVTAQLSEELELVGNSGGVCSGAPIVCTVPDLGKDEQATVRLVAQAVRTGTGSVAATTTASTADPNVARNAAGASVSVQWRPGRCANVFTAGAKNDVKHGTAAGDSIDGLFGNDVLAGLGGADCLDGGLGNDRLGGDDGNDRLDGGPGRDIISGGSGSDTIDGGSGADRIAGHSGPDHIDGGSGNDRINAIDRRRDTVDCGSGDDVVRADRGDRLKRCETVVYAKKKKKKKR